MGEKKLSYWDSHEELGPQPPCAGAELDNETGQPNYSYSVSTEEDKQTNQDETM
ncbi:hypothetical protein [Pseudidiomarina atlantica]|jgi:hypothetical protein|uniref:hypothetical protein n=1 Tax=Pseudidiomarina atlantica TaxID=1517416 RepID=UPI000AC229EA|nr:hypothetical protein [Pseudidiomarina atlantica]